MYPLPKPVSNKQVNYIHVPEYRNHVAVVTGGNGLFDNLDSRTKQLLVVGAVALIGAIAFAGLPRNRK